MIITFIYVFYVYINGGKNMCWTGIILNPYKNLFLNSIIDGIYKQMIDNPHGFFLYTIFPQVYIRTTDITVFKKLFDEIVDLTPICMYLHFRYASAGLISLDNVHGWQIGDYYIAHNGIVTEYCIELQQQKSDTLYLIEQKEFQELLLTQQWDKLFEFCDTKGFYGVMFIVKHDFSEIYGISIGKPIKYHKFNNMAFITSGKFITNKCKHYIDGIFKINFKDVEKLTSISLAQIREDNTYNTHL